MQRRDSRLARGAVWSGISEETMRKCTLSRRRLFDSFAASYRLDAKSQLGLTSRDGFGDFQYLRSQPLRRVYPLV
jgi:hypothetical protein